jgi:hypothetical protein
MPFETQILFGNQTNLTCFILFCIPMQKESCGLQNILLTREKEFPTLVMCMK